LRGTIEQQEIMKTTSRYLIAISLDLFSCQNAVETSGPEVEGAQPKAAAPAEQDLTDLDKPVLLQEIKDMRKEIETWSKQSEPITLSTDSLRAKTKQKWFKIHIYSKDGEVQRIKTYPHEGISDRTEEFYFSEGELILAVIEDNGSTKAEAEMADKMYFFHAGKLIGEEKGVNEKEYAIESSDAEELLQEAAEYLDLAKGK